MGLFDKFKTFAAIDRLSDKIIKGLAVLSMIFGFIILIQHGNDPASIGESPSESGRVFGQFIGMLILSYSLWYKKWWIVALLIAMPLMLVLLSYFQ